MTVPDDRYRARRDALRPALADAGVDALLVTHLPNVRYLSGFSGSNAVLVVGADAEADVIGTDGRYQDQVREESPDLPTVIDRSTLEAVATRVTGRVAVESHLPVGDVVRTGASEPVVLSSTVEALRSVKDAVELDAIERACRITSDAFGLLADEIRVGDTELVLARRLEQLFGLLGAEDRAFDSIVAGGPHSAIPHHQPGRRALEPGDLLVIDAGARVDGYHADMTRTFIVGAAPQPWQREIHASVEQARGRAAAAYRVGQPCREVDDVARGSIAEDGYADRFTHGLGHGVGLEIHEAPNVSQRSTGSIGVQMAITVEPGVYLTGQGGVRIEDTLVVTDAGPRILTEAPRELREVG